MAFLKINGKDYEAKTNFKFERVANEKYATEEVNGFMAIYLGLLQQETSAVRNFWDCALAHYKNDKPAVEDIEEALEERIEEEGDTDSLLKEAFQTLDNAGFFKKQARFIVGEFTKEPKKLKDETPEQAKDRKEKAEAAKMMKARYEELTA